MRSSWDQYFIGLAHEASTRGTCPRRKVGCLIVKDRRIMATGYNGAPSGHPHCLDVGCDLAPDRRCIRTVHAERNAILVSTASTRAGSTLFTTDFPCPACAHLIAHRGIVEVVYDKPYHKYLMREVKELFDYHGIAIRKVVYEEEVA